jgi:hypothetical protein
MTKINVLLRAVFLQNRQNTAILGTLDILDILNLLDLPFPDNNVQKNFSYTQFQDKKCHFIL